MPFCELLEYNSALSHYQDVKIVLGDFNAWAAQLSETLASTTKISVEPLFRVPNYSLRKSSFLTISRWKNSKSDNFFCAAKNVCQKTEGGFDVKKLPSLQTTERFITRPAPLLSETTHQQHGIKKLWIGISNSLSIAASEIENSNKHLVQWVLPCSSGEKKVAYLATTKRTGCDRYRIKEDNWVWRDRGTARERSGGKIPRKQTATCKRTG